MDNQYAIDKLNLILRAEIEVASAHEQILHQSNRNELCSIATYFYEQHVDHIENLRSLVLSLKGAPIEVDRFIFATREMKNREDIVNIMKNNESSICQLYKELIVEGVLPEEVNSLLEKCYADEKNHLEKIQTLLFNQFN